MSTEGQDAPDTPPRDDDDKAADEAKDKQFMFEQWDKMNGTDWANWNWTMFADMPGDRAVLFLQWHIEKQGLSVNDSSTCTPPLHRAASNGLQDCVKYLIEQKADLEAQETDFGYTALQEAAIQEHIHCMRILLEARADPDAHPEGKLTPLMLCARDGLLPHTRLLLEAGAKLDIDAPNPSNRILAALGLKTDKNQTALEMAREAGNTKIVELIESVQHLDWSAESHKRFPDQSKSVVVALLILHRTELSKVGKEKNKRLKAYHADPKNRFWKLPRPLLFRILGFALKKARYVPP